MSKGKISCFFYCIKITVIYFQDLADNTNNRVVQEKTITSNKTSTRRSVSPSDETKVNKKNRPAANADVREWDIPKLQEEKEKSPVERNVVEEPKGNYIHVRIISFYLFCTL